MIGYDADGNMLNCGHLAAEWGEEIAFLEGEAKRGVCRKREMESIFLDKKERGLLTPWEKFEEEYRKLNKEMEEGCWRYAEVFKVLSYLDEKRKALEKGDEKELLMFQSYEPYKAHNEKEAAKLKEELEKERIEECWKFAEAFKALSDAQKKAVV